MLSSQVKFSADRQSERLTDSQTLVKQYAPDLSMWRHKKVLTHYPFQNNNFLTLPN